MNTTNEFLFLMSCSLLWYMNSTLGCVSSASCTDGNTMTSSHFSGIYNSARKQTTFGMADHTHHYHNRRATSLLVLPVLYQSSLSTGHHSHASTAQSQSKMSASTSILRHCKDIVSVIVICYDVILISIQ